MTPNSRPIKRGRSGGVVDGRDGLLVATTDCCGRSSSFSVWDYQTLVWAPHAAVDLRLEALRGLPAVCTVKLSGSMYRKVNHRRHYGPIFLR